MGAVGAQKFDLSQMEGEKLGEPVRVGVKYQQMSPPSREDESKTKQIPNNSTDFATQIAKYCQPPSVSVNRSEVVRRPEQQATMEDANPTEEKEDVDYMKAFEDISLGFEQCEGTAQECYAAALRNYQRMLRESQLAEERIQRVRREEGRVYEKLIKELKGMRNGHENGLLCADLDKAVRNLQSLAAAVELGTKRVKGVLRESRSLRAHKEVAVEDVGRYVQIMKDSVVRKLAAEREIQEMTVQLEKEQERAQSSVIQDYEGVIETLTQQLNTAASVSAVTEPSARPSVIVAPLSKSQKRRKNWPAEKKRNKNQAKKAKAALRQKPIFPHFERAQRRVCSDVTIIAAMEHRGYRKSLPFGFSANHYINSPTRVQLKKKSGPNGQDEEIFNGADRFWMAVQRFQNKLLPNDHSETGVRILDLAHDFRINPGLLHLYRFAKRETYLGFPPAEFDCVVAEIDEKADIADSMEWIAKCYTCLSLDLPAYVIAID